MTEYGETRQRALDGFERYRMAGASLDASWPAAGDARAAAVQPFLGAIALNVATMQSALDTQEGAHSKLTETASCAVAAVDLATLRAQDAKAQLEVAAAAIDAARAEVMQIGAAATAGTATLAEVRSILARIAGQP